MDKQGYILPAILSAVIPGLGQLVKGQAFKAVFLWVVVTACWFTFGQYWLLWVVYGFCWLVNVLDAAYTSPAVK